MKDFLLGCNYWSFNAGADMWHDWDPEQVEKDMALLKEHKMTTIRVFPNWRDFQPIVPLYGPGGVLQEILMEGETAPENPFYLSEIMLSRFETFCDLAGKYGIRLIVGLITGWMSGRVYIPGAMYGRNLITDQLALRFQRRFIKGFVSRFKDRPEIYAWDLGNECNCISPAPSADAAYVWSAMISDAIKAEDPTRPVISGMHGLGVEGKYWTIADQGECTDILTTHPYPQFVPHCKTDPIDSIRTLMHATCETLLYSAISKKPCFPEELGTLGTNICSDAVSAVFLRVNLLSNWAHNAEGLLWWCMNEQSHLDAAPYRWTMLERELGMFDAQQKPKTFAHEMLQFADWLEQTDMERSAPRTDAAILLTKDQDHWGMAYMSFILAKQAGLTCTFVAPNHEVPDSEVYIIPCVHYDQWMYKPCYRQLKQKVFEGATVYISGHDGYFTEKEDFLGISILNTELKNESGHFELEDALIPYARSRKQTLRPTTATVLAKDEQGDPIVTVNNYGCGKVYYVNFPLEDNLLTVNHAFDGDVYKLYELVFADALQTVDVRKNNKMVGITENGSMVTLINYSNQPQHTGLLLQNGKRIDRILRGDPYCLQPCDGAVFTLK